LKIGERGFAPPDFACKWGMENGFLVQSMNRPPSKALQADLSGKNNNQAFQKVCEASLARLESIAKELGVSDKPFPRQIGSKSFRELAAALVLCPDDYEARKVLVQHAAGYPEFLCVARQVGAHIANGQFSFYEEIEEGVTQYFYLGRFVDSLIEMLDTVMKSEDYRKRMGLL
jgi:hypothetical protein